MDYKFDLSEAVATIQQDNLQVRPFSGLISATCESGLDSAGAADSFILSIPSHNYTHRFYLLGNKFFVNGVEKTSLALNELKVYILKNVFIKVGGATSTTSTATDLTFTNTATGPVLTSPTGKKARLILVDNSDGTTSLTLSDPF